MSKTNGFVAVDAVIAHIWFGKVKDTGDKEEMLYCFKIMVSGFEAVVVESVIA